ncbi:MAG: glycosyltransferase family protein [Verrucomicrobia bacterium]|nr:glycosyltransferase family protein [Verrucomicrobiota bacterium]MBU1908617.1 glycosyltransferase family protein [Verrucomicrobiota bacterium]
MTKGQTRSVMAILQARMGSSRLPGKMLLPIYGEKGALELMLERVRRARLLDRTVVATTVSAQDDPLEKLCARLGVPCFRGSEDDVLDRYYQAAIRHGPASVIVRLTGDCPLHDGRVIDEAVQSFLSQHVHYLSNAWPPVYPDGLDTEVFWFTALETAWKEARLKSEREHVTPYIRNHPERFRIGHIPARKDLSALRWTLDEPRDLQFIRAVFARLGDREFGFEDVLSLLEREPGLGDMNAGMQRNEGYLKSLREDHQS